ncbi:MAG: hypothetical protein EZS28_036947 [Streblomastix strix]|uniref:Uncharacterized protein n=1 Tax=Streblomastix strix TaxID=222440 RepID=A0A5J4U9G5_9EUKA|nr:MAG: hypothetical protein EZS28_036947 [Streblomastix strix]
MQVAAEQIKQDAYVSQRPALVALPSILPQIAPAKVLTQQSMSVMVDDEAKKLYIHRNLAFVSSALLSSKARPKIKKYIYVHQIYLVWTEVNKLGNFKDFTSRFSE